MGVALGWMALALAAVAGTPETGRGGMPIKYTVRFVDAQGLGWREAAFTRLTPVTRQGSATVWTAPRSVEARLLQCGPEGHGAKVVQAPTVVAWSGAPAHITMRANRQLVTQVAWKGDDGSVATKPETVRTGSVTTLTGRKLDQGILVQMVLQDTQILAVHRVTLEGSGEPKSSPETKKAAYHVEDCEQGAACCQAAENTKTATTRKWTFQWEWNLGAVSLPPARYIHDDVRYFPIDPEFPWTQTQAATERARRRVTEMKLEPAATSGVVAASLPASECCSDATTCASCSKGCESHAVAIEVPEIGSQEIAGEWLVPNDGILLVSFGPHTVADKDGRAVVRERLAIIEAEETAEGAIPSSRPSMPSPGVVVPTLNAPAFVPQPLPSASIYGLPSPRPMMPPMGATPAPPPPPAPVVGVPGVGEGPGVGVGEAAMPPIPSRSIPQGYHGDGKAAELPPLPARADDDDDSSGSAEPRPSPQTRKSRQPQPAQPSADSATKKAQYSMPSFPAIPTLFQPAPAVGLQFLVPIKPVSLRLPFNRRLELEIYGRVVRNPEPAPSSAELVAKPAKDGAATK